MSNHQVSTDEKKYKLTLIHQLNQPGSKLWRVDLLVVGGESDIGNEMLAAMLQHVAPPGLTPVFIHRGDFIILFSTIDGKIHPWKYSHAYYNSAADNSPSLGFYLRGFNGEGHYVGADDQHIISDGYVALGDLPVISLTSV